MTESPLSVNDLAADIVAACAHDSVRVVCERGDVLLHQDERPAHVFFIDEGVCKLVWRAADGVQALVGLRPTGWLVGSIDGLSRREQPYAAECVGRCVVRQIPLSTFLRRLEDPCVLRALLQIHGLKMDQERRVHLLTLASLRARTRVVMLLSWLSSERIAIRHENDSQGMTSALSQRDMADLLAITPETFTRVIRDLERDGVIIKRNGWITLLGTAPMPTCSVA